MVKKQLTLEERESRFRIICDGVSDGDKVYYFDTYPGRFNKASDNTDVFLSRPYTQHAEALIRGHIHQLPIFANLNATYDDELRFKTYPDLGMELIECSPNAPLLFRMANKLGMAKKPLKERTFKYGLPAGFCFDAACCELWGRLRLGTQDSILASAPTKRSKALFNSALAYEGEPEENHEGDAIVIESLLTLIKQLEMNEVSAPISMLLDSVPLQPSTYNLAARKNLPHDLYDFRSYDESNEVRCLLDIVYHSLSSFALNERGKSTLRRCRECSHLFFSFHGNEKRCLYRSIEPGFESVSCRNAAKLIASNDSNLSSAVSRKQQSLQEKIKKAIDSDMCNRSYLDEFHSGWKELLQECQGDLRKNERKLSWLKSYERRCQREWGMR